jgi:cytochrome c-type biogenesis protein CcmF
MVELGEFALWMALPLAIWGSLAAFLGGARGRRDFVVSAERSAHAATILLGVATAGLTAALAGDRFELAYVHLHSPAGFSTAAKVAALWVGEEGALLVRGVGLCLATSLFVWMYRGRIPPLMPWATGVLLALVAAVVVLLLVAAPPFGRLGYVPAGGVGVLPGQAGAWAVIHSPALHLGMGAVAVPFALALSGLLTGRIDARWAAPARDWALIGWVFLTVALLARTRWSYEVLGRGEVWSWHPTEAVLLATWLCISALLHSLGSRRDPGGGRFASLALACAAFAVSWGALTVTRTGLEGEGPGLVAEPGPERVLLVVLGAVAVVPALLLLHRLPRFRGMGAWGPLRTGGGGGVRVGVVLAAWGLGIVWGAILPVIAETLYGAALTVGPGYFSWLSAGMLALLAGVMGLAALPARRGREGERAEVAGPGSPGCHAGGARVGRWGGRLAHGGFVVTLVGVLASGTGGEALETMSPGASTRLASPFGGEYTVVYQGTSVRPGPEGWSWVSLLSVQRNGAPLGTVTTERKITGPGGLAAVQPGLRVRPMEDLFVRLEEVDERLGTLNDPEFQRATFLLRLNPLASWIWLGGVAMGLGGLLAIHGGRVK